MCFCFYLYQTKPNNLKFRSYLYVFLALFYFVGRTGFLSLPDVFNKTRPNRHINMQEVPQQTLLKQRVHAFEINNQKAKCLNAHIATSINHAGVILGGLNTVRFSLAKSYNGLYINPPPLLL